MSTSVIKFCAVVSHDGTFAGVTFRSVKLGKSWERAARYYDFKATGLCRLPER